MRARILVIDDDVRITSMLQRSLSFEGYAVIAHHDGAAGLQEVRTQPPDAVILDVMMPGMDGWAVCRCIREEGYDVAVLMLTARDDIPDRVRGLDVGADDYMVKPFALEELLARLRALLRRRRHASALHEPPPMLQFGDLTLHAHTREVFRQARQIELTAKEFDLLHFFLMHPRRVLQRDVLMQKIWGYDFIGESNVLEVYVAMLRQKLEEGGEPRLIQTVRGTGYVLREQRP
jgi:two-component system response regulator MprA